MDNTHKYIDQNVFDKFSIGCITIGFDWKVIYSNEAANNLALEKGKLIGKKILEIHPDLEKSEVFSALKRSMEERIPQHSEAPFVFPGNITRWYEFRTEPIEDGVFVAMTDITEREENMERYRILFEGLTDAAFVHELTDGMPGKFIAVNDAACKQFGYTREELLSGNITIADLDAPGAPAAPKDIVLRLKRGEHFQFEQIHVAKDGHRIFVEVNTQSFLLEGRRVVITVERDISERKKNEEALKEKEKELNEAQRLAKIGNWTAMGLDPSRAKITWSPEMCRLVGRDPSIPPPNLTETLDYIVPEYAQKYAETIENAVRSGESFYIELKLKDMPGRSTEWILSTGEVVRDEKGNPIGMRGAAQDITERKRVEIKLAKIARTLKAISLSDQLLIHATDEIKLLNDVCQALVDVGYKFAWVGFKQDDPGKTINPVAKAGHEEGYLESLNITWADTEYGHGLASKAIRTGEMVVVKDTFTDPSFALWRDQAIKHGFFSSISLPVKIDGTIGALSMYATEKNAFSDDEIEMLKNFSNDLSYGIKSIRTEQERKKGLVRIKELSELRSKFLTIMSHQLRTPLTVFQWNLELLLGGELGEMKEIQKEYLHVLYDANESLISRVDDLLTAINIEEGTVLIKKEEVAVDSIALVVAKETEKKCALKKIIFTYHAPEVLLPTIQGDAEKLRRMFHVLLENAVAYTPEGGSITAKLEAKNGGVRFEVLDTGIGIPQNEQHHIFDRFFRASNASVMQTEAFGVGLHTLKYFVEKHGGTVGFRSQENVGTTFWLELPSGQAENKQ